MGGCTSRPKTGPSGPRKLRRLQLVGQGTLSVIQELGGGAWSDVYLVERIKDGRHYALKQTLITELSEAEQRHRRSETHIAEKKVWGFLLQATVGLQHLHASNIVHRDIKPANILINKEGVLKIADLGVAGLLHMGSSKLQIGTPQYMAPEMHAGRAYSFAADVWSLGCLVYELCVLQPLFQDREEEVVARKVLATTLPPALPSKYSSELQVLFNRMMQHDPELRPSIDKILQSPQLQSRMNLLPAGLERNLSQLNLSLGSMEGIPVLPAIDIPEDLQELNQRLPPPRYSSDNLDRGGAMEMAARFGAPAIQPACALPSAAADTGAPAAAPSSAEAGPSAAAADAGCAVAAAAAAAAAATAAAAVTAKAEAGCVQQQQQPQPQPQHPGAALAHLPRIASPVTVLESELCSTASGSVATPCGGPGTGGSGGFVDACVKEALDEERAGAGQAAARKQEAALAWAGRPAAMAATSPFAAQRARYVSD
ncbi:hypothetical protein ABPG75_000842 [Micractinium tetrahymenae]